MGNKTNLRTLRNLNLESLQHALRELYYEVDKERGLFKTFAWLVEEIGELSEAMLKDDRKQIEEEIADVIAWTISVANLLDINVGNAICKKYTAICTQTWDK